MADRFGANSPGLNSPLTKVVAVTKHDTNPISAVTTDGPCRAIYSEIAGTINFIDAEGNTITNFPLPALTWMPMRIATVKTGGSATNLWAGW